MSDINIKVNSQEYWDRRFQTSDWEKCEGDGQTKFFAKLACTLFPEWFVKDVNKNLYTICDLGCAEGDSLPVLQKLFIRSKLVGEDFSKEAINIARNKYHTFQFHISDILKPEKESVYPVVFSSNTLEHFPNTYEVMKCINERTSNYMVLLIPFREDFEVTEHEVVLDTYDIPLIIGESQLVYANSVECNSKFYGREQLLLIYSKCEEIKNSVLLSDIVEKVRNLSYKVCEEKRNKLQTDWQDLNDKLFLANDTVKVLDDKYKKKVEELERLEQATSEEIHMQRKEIDAQREGLNSRIMEYEKESVEFRQSILEKEDLIRQLKEENEQLQTIKVGLNESYQIIQEARQAKSYKYLLGIRRLKDQLIKGSKHEKKDFIKYSANKFIKSKKTCRTLSEFDKLRIVERNLSDALMNQAGNISNSPENSSVHNFKNQKETRQIYIFSGIPYYDIGGGQRCSQLAKTFDKMGYEVYYYYAFDSSETIKFDLVLPMCVHKYIDDTSVEEVFFSIKEDALFIFEAPYSKFVPFLEKAVQLQIKTIYEHIDNWETSLGSLLYDPESFQCFIEKSDVIVATSIELKKQLFKYTSKEIYYAANAVDINMFEPKFVYREPEDLIKGKDKTLLYFGSLWGEWFDWELLTQTARNCPDSSFNLIGDYSALTDRMKDFPQNLHFLGLKKQLELPAYLKYSDIAILPFKNCEIGKYVSPLKIFEYIAMEKMVLATPLPDIIDYPNTICSEDFREWVSAINQTPEVQNPADFIADNSWYSRCNLLLEVGEVDYMPLTELREKSISVIVLNHNNKSVVVRCIDSLIKHSGRYKYQIVVVDNASSDGSVEMLEETYGDRILLVKNEKNGCSSGRNKGVENSTGEIIVFLDSDQWVICDRWLDAALYILKKNRSIGAVSWGAGWFDKGVLTGPIVDYYPNRAIKPSQLFREDISYLATSGFVIEKRIFELTDGFDECYDPTCFEDTDLSFQVQHLGLKVVYSPYMGIMHLPHQTTNSGSKVHSQLMNKNGTYFLEKWTGLDYKLLERAWDMNIR